MTGVEKERDLVVYFGGGAMTGVFGAGVATAFQEANLYPRIKAVYSASAGAFTGAYFLARQTPLGSSIYWEDLINGFISIKRFWIGVWQRLKNRFIGTVPWHKLKDALDITLLMQVAKSRKKLNVGEILKQSIPLYIKLLNLDTDEIEYLECHRPDLFDVLEAGVSIFPYVHEVVVIDGKRYCDAAPVNIVGFEELRKRHPKKTIVIVLNVRISAEMDSGKQKRIEGKFMEWMFDDPRFDEMYKNSLGNLTLDVEKMKRDGNVILIQPPEDPEMKLRTTQRDILLKTYRAGIEAGESVVRQLVL